MPQQKKLTKSEAKKRREKIEADQESKTVTYHVLLLVLAPTDWTVSKQNQPAALAIQVRLAQNLWEIGITKTMQKIAAIETGLIETADDPEIETADDPENEKAEDLGNETSSIYQRRAQQCTIQRIPTNSKGLGKAHLL